MEVNDLANVVSDFANPSMIMANIIMKQWNYGEITVKVWVKLGPGCNLGWG